MYITHFVYLFICGWTLGLFPPFGYYDNDAMNVGVQISVQVPAFSSSRYIPRSGIAESYGPFLV